MTLIPQKHSSRQADVFTFLDGREYELSGIKGRFRYETLEARYPRRELLHRLYHQPCRDQPEYQQFKGQYGDDWDTDLSDSPTPYAIAEELGYNFVSG